MSATRREVTWVCSRRLVEGCLSDARFERAGELNRIRERLIERHRTLDLRTFHVLHDEVGLPHLSHVARADLREDLVRTEFFTGLQVHVRAGRLHIRELMSQMLRNL